MTATLRRHALPASLVVIVAVGFEVAYGAPLGDALLYLLYEAGFVVLPGWLAYLALSRAPGGPLRQLAFGWALGYALEVLAFMLTAAAGARSLFVLYPPLAAAISIAVLSRRRREGSIAQAVTAADRVPRRLVWLGAGLCSLIAAYVAVAYFPVTPLPGAENVSYFQDFPWSISIAADAKHHWPIEDAGVAGQPFPYHYFVHIHLAAASQVTGIGLPVIYFRFFILPLVVLFTIQLVVAGRALAGRFQVGLIAAALTLLVGELQLDASQELVPHIPFLGVFFTFILLSPSFLFGLVIYVPLLVLVAERLTGSRRAAAGDWLLLTLFAVAATDAKTSILPSFLVALLLFALWSAARHRRVPAVAWQVFGLLLAAMAVVYLLQYRGHSSGLELDPPAAFNFFNDMPGVSLVKGGLEDLLPSFPGRHALLFAGGLPFGMIGLYGAQLIGLAWIFRRQGGRLRPAQAWLGCLFIAGFLALFLSAQGSGNQLYFVFLGLVAGCLLSADGLWLAWSTRPRPAGEGRIALLGAAWLAAIAGVIAAPIVLDLFSGPDSGGHTYVFLYLGLALSLLLLYVAARRWAGPRRWAAAALVCAALLAVGSLDTPVNYLYPQATNPPDAPQSGHRLTPELLGALAWIRDHTPADAVLAVNNPLPYEYDYSAFAERRVFIEGWAYSSRTRDLGYGDVINGKVNPFAGRLRANSALFARGDRAVAARLAHDQGLRYLLIDTVNGPPTNLPAVRALGRTVYRAPGVTVIELRAA